jgi:hypothetical protein|tara:strand:- start:2854 stop:3093 length:240 start_codon:yes stop_codon:yes gene_type:complete
MRKCLETCRSLNTSCPVEDCKYWIEYDKDFNCTLESIERNGNMTLRQVAERIGVSFVRIKQIEDKALKKIGHLLDKESI